MREKAPADFNSEGAGNDPAFLNLELAKNILLEDFTYGTFRRTRAAIDHYPCRGASRPQTDLSSAILNLTSGEHTPITNGCNCGSPPEIEPMVHLIGEFGYVRSPPARAISQTKPATEAATFQPAIRAVARSDGRLIAGPANSNATAAPVGNPAESKLKAKGISKNVGRASGTARVATSRIASSRGVPPAKASAGNN